MWRIVLICFFILCICPYVQADIFKYTDDNGVICYTDAPFGKKTAKPIKEKADTPSPKGKISKAKYVEDADYHSIVHEKATQYDLDPSLIKAVIKTESNWNSRAVSPKGAMGLMQLMPTTARDLNVNNPYDPEENIEGGTKYLKYLLERFNGDLTLALAAYNAGPNKVEKYGYVPPIPETKQYVKKVISLYNGKTEYSTAESEVTKNTKKSEPIYKVVLEDGTVLFTNSTFFAKNPVRF